MCKLHESTWAIVKRGGTLEEASLTQCRGNIQKAIRKMTAFSDGVSVKTVNRVLRESHAVARCPDYGLCIGSTTMLIYACPNCGETFINTGDWRHGLRCETAVDGQ